MHWEILLGPITEIPAEPIGGYADFFKVVIDSLDNHHFHSFIGGTFWFRFEITREGKMSHVELIKGVNPREDERILKIFQNLDYPFEPAKQRGRPVKYQLVLPIRFELKD